MSAALNLIVLLLERGQVLWILLNKLCFKAGRFWSAKASWICIARGRKEVVAGCLDLE
jgi:hypothetical protein